MIILLFLSLFHLYPSQTDSNPEPAEWLTDFEEACQQANEKNLPVLMVFSGSDWCKPCIKLRKEVFENPYFVENAPGHFILLNLDFPRYKKNRLPKEVEKHHYEMADLYNPKGEFPLVLILKNKKVIGRTGYSAEGAQAYLEDLIQITQETDENQ